MELKIKISYTNFEYDENGEVSSLHTMFTAEKEGGTFSISGNIPLNIARIDEHGVKNIKKAVVEAMAEIFAEASKEA